MAILIIINLVHTHSLGVYFSIVLSRVNNTGVHLWSRTLTPSFINIRGGNNKTALRGWILEYCTQRMKTPQNHTAEAGSYRSGSATLGPGPLGWPDSPSSRWSSSWSRVWQRRCHGSEGNKPASSGLSHTRDWATPEEGWKERGKQRETE